jgi:transcriptional regulator with XRE-family HTH domain
MLDDLILIIGDKIKQKRSQKNITLEELARRAGVSKGLISQIENNRTVPSLPVLFSIIHALEEDLKSFFEDLYSHFSNEHVIIIRKNEAQKFEKEPVSGFTYRRILTKGFTGNAVDFVMLTLRKGANRRTMIRTDAFEFKFILKGSIEYQIEDKLYNLEEGDALFFDGRARHRLKNIGNSEALILIVYLF